MIVLLSILIGFYIVADSIYLAAKTDGEDRFCILARYAGAMMSGLYLMFDSTSEELILFGTTIALFMWPDTYYRVTEHIRTFNPYLYQSFISRFAPRPRRKSDTGAEL
jgi:hypothetical protein